MPDTDANLTPAKVPLVREVWGIFKTLQVAKRNLLEIIPELATRQPMVSGTTGIVRWHMVMDPDALKIILKDRLENYPKSIVTKNMLRPGIGNSIFIAEGAHWRWQRQAAAPVFQYRNIANLAPIMSIAADAACARLDNATGNKADLFQEMVTTTYEVISDVTFSGGDKMDSAAVQKAIDAYIDQTARISLFDVLGFPDWVPRPGRLFKPKAILEMKNIAHQAIEGRRKDGARKIPDLLDLLLAGQDPETKRRMNTQELADNLLTFIVAGHETTALTLSWALYLCAFDPAVQEKLRTEAAFILQGRTATAEDVDNLPYTKMVIEETLRLYPPAAFLSRTAQAPDVLCDREVRKGDTVMLPIYALHRNHLLWDNPDQFDPERFAPGHNINRFAWLPFGDGPRVCIGAQFAMMEAQIILATLISRYRFTRIPGKDPIPQLVLTLRPVGGVHLQFEKLT